MKYARQETDTTQRRNRHAAHVRAAKIALALLAVLVAGSASGQGAAQTGTAAQTAPASSTPALPLPPPGPSYGPVLHPQTTRSEPGAQPDQSPQAQEEKAGVSAVPRHQEVDPSARPAPQQKDPAKAGNGKAGQKDNRKQARRRAVQGQAETVAPVSSTPPAPPVPPAPPPLQPVSLVPGPARINSCQNGICTDTEGAVYNTGGGNAGVSSAGRLCTRSGNTMQCL